MHCALWSSRDRWQLNHSGYDEFWNLMTMWIQMWFHVTSKTLNLRDARKTETQSNYNILSLKYLGDAYGNYRFSFTLQNIVNWEKVLEFLFFPCIIYLENLSDGLQEQTKIFLTKTLRNLKGYGRKTCGKNNHTLFTTTWNQWSQETSSIHIYTDTLTLVNFKFSKEILNFCLVPVAWLVLRIKAGPILLLFASSNSFCSLLMIWNQTPRFTCFHYVKHSHYNWEKKCKVCAAIVICH